MKVTKAIIAVAGYGTRMLPITRAIEKCMLTVGTRPVIDYVVDDILAAGIRDIYFVVSKEQSQLEAYYSQNDPLLDYLQQKGKSELLELAQPPHDVQFHYLLQPQDGRYGTSVPVSIAADYIDENESAIVIMGDQFFWRTDGGSNTADLMRLAQERQTTAGMLGVPMPLDGIDSSIETDPDGNFVRIVEKPAPGEAPSDLQNASFYLFDKAMFRLAKSVPPNPIRGEYEITDVMNTYVSNGGRLAIGQTVGQYMECGSPAGLLRANQTIAMHTM